jgi:hypothetical protein
MKAKLKFKLPEENVEFKNASDAGQAFSLLHDIDETIREFFKYGEGTTADKVLNAVRERIREEFPDLDER